MNSNIENQQQSPRNLMSQTDSEGNPENLLREQTSVNDTQDHDHKRKAVGDSNPKTLKNLKIGQTKEFSSGMQDSTPDIKISGNHSQNESIQEANQEDFNHDDEDSFSEDLFNEKGKKLEYTKNSSSGQEQSNKFSSGMQDGTPDIKISGNHSQNESIQEANKEVFNHEDEDPLTPTQVIEQVVEDPESPPTFSEIKEMTMKLIVLKKDWLIALTRDQLTSLIGLLLRQEYYEQGRINIFAESLLELMEKMRENILGFDGYLERIFRYCSTDWFLEDMFYRQEKLVFKIELNLLNSNYLKFDFFGYLPCSLLNQFYNMTSRQLLFTLISMLFRPKLGFEACIKKISFGDESGGQKRLHIPSDGIHGVDVIGEMAGILGIRKNDLIPILNQFVDSLPKRKYKGLDDDHISSFGSDLRSILASNGYYKRWWNVSNTLDSLKIRYFHHAYDEKEVDQLTDELLQGGLVAIFTSNLSQRRKVELTKICLEDSDGNISFPDSMSLDSQEILFQAVLELAKCPVAPTISAYWMSYLEKREIIKLFGEVTGREVIGADNLTKKRLSQIVKEFQGQMTDYSTYFKVLLGEIMKECSNSWFRNKQRFQFNLDWDGKYAFLGEMFGYVSTDLLYQFYDMTSRQLLFTLISMLFRPKLGFEACIKKISFGDESGGQKRLHIPSDGINGVDVIGEMAVILGIRKDDLIPILNQFIDSLPKEKYNEKLPIGYSQDQFERDLQIFSVANHVLPYRENRWRKVEDEIEKIEDHSDVEEDDKDDEGVHEIRVVEAGNPIAREERFRKLVLNLEGYLLEDEQAVDNDYEEGDDDDEEVNEAEAVIEPNPNDSVSQASDVHVIDLIEEGAQVRSNTIIDLIGEEELRENPVIILDVVEEDEDMHDSSTDEMPNDNFHHDGESTDSEPQM